MGNIQRTEDHYVIHVKIQRVREHYVEDGYTHVQTRGTNKETTEMASIHLVAQTPDALYANARAALETAIITVTPASDVTP